MWLKVFSKLDCFLKIEFVKLKFQPKIELLKLDLDLTWKKKKKVELEFSKFKFHLKIIMELVFASLKFLLVYFFKGKACVQWIFSLNTLDLGHVSKSGRVQWKNSLEKSLTLFFKVWNLSLLNSISTFFFFLIHVKSKSSLGNSILDWNLSFTNSIFKKQSNLLNTFSRILFTEYFSKNILFTKFCP